MTKKTTETMSKGTLEIDMIIAFILILFTFYICANIESQTGDSLRNSITLQSETALKIARSYEVLSQLSDKRDNEITMLRLNMLKPQDVSLRTYTGYIYGGEPHSFCVERAVYIKDLNEVGILEVC